jgi:hypothetical protein
MISAVSDSLTLACYKIKSVVMRGGIAASSSANYPLQPCAIPRYVIDDMKLFCFFYAAFFVIIGLESVVKYIATAPATSDTIQNMKVA